MRKRIWGLMLVLSMLLSLVPTVANASESGTCGDNLTWTLDNGTLTISGTGNMYDYNYNNEVKPPWYKERENITSVNISDGVTAIGSDAFQFFTSLSNINIPNSVTFIGKGAFTRCDLLTNVDISSAVTFIGQSAFAECNSLTDINVDSDNEMYCSQNGVLYNKDESRIICYPAGKTNSVYSIPDGVAIIERSAFLKSKLQTLKMPESVEYIDSWAFAYSTSLKNINIPKNVSTLGNAAFMYCQALESISIPDMITTIDDSTFSNCTSLKNISIPKSVTTIGYYTFYSCQSLADVYYGGTENQWNNISFGTLNSGLDNATIHFNSKGIPVPEITEITNVENNHNGTYSVTTKVTNIPYDCVIIAALYNENGLAGINSQALSSADTEKTIVVEAGNANEVKVFVWSSFKELRQICEVKEVEI